MEELIECLCSESHCFEYFVLNTERGKGRPQRPRATSPVGFSQGLCIGQAVILNLH
jgi:hypothetical protein